MKIKIDGREAELKFTPAAIRRLSQLGWEPKDLQEKISDKIPLFERINNLIELLWCMTPQEVRETYPQANDAFADALGMEVLAPATIKGLGDELLAAAAALKGE